MNSVSLTFCNQQQFKNNNNGAKNNPSFTADFKIAKEVGEIANKYMTYRKPINRVKGIFKSIKNYSVAIIKKGPRNVSYEETQEISLNSFTKSLFPDSAKAFIKDFQKRTKSILPGEVEMIPGKVVTGTEPSSLVRLKYTSPNGEIVGPTLGTPVTNYIPVETDSNSLKMAVENVISDLAFVKNPNASTVDFRVALHDVQLDRYM